MKGHFRKLFGFLASTNSDNYVNYTRSGSGVPLQLPVHMKPLTMERIHVYVIISGEGDLNNKLRQQYHAKKTKITACDKR